MKYLSTKCEECGGQISAETFCCERCGKEAKRPASAAVGDSGESFAMFKESPDRSIGNAVPRSSAAASCKLYDPEVWMYIVSVIFPFLSVVMMAVYMNHNDFDNAKKIFFKPMIIQIVIYGIVGIIILAGM